MQQNPPRRALGPSASGSSPEASVGNEEHALETLLLSLARGAVPQAAWEKVHAEARQTERLSELAFAFESVAQGKRIKAVPPAAAAEFLHQAGRFLSDGFGDDVGAVAYLERALALVPGHAAAFSKLEQLLRKSQQHRKLVELYAAAAAHRPRGEQAALLRRATEALAEAEGADERMTELLQQILRLDPGDEPSRERLEGIYVRASRFRDVVRLNEQALGADPGPTPPTRLRLLARVVEIYADRLGEPERALPHVEQLLALDPTHEGARKVAERLVAVRGIAGRAAAALATAYEASGTPEQVARYLSLELESTRGPKRAGLLLRLGKLRQTRMGDAAGAFDCFEQALAIDPDDDARGRYVELALAQGRHAEAAKTLTRVVSTAKDPAVRSKAGAQLGEVLLAGGDAKRRRPSRTSSRLPSRRPMRSSVRPTSSGGSSRPRETAPGSPRSSSRSRCSRTTARNAAGSTSSSRSSRQSSETRRARSRRTSVFSAPGCGRRPSRRWRRSTNAAAIRRSSRACWKNAPPTPTTRARPARS
jgi:tetratricopeptide (TPR) repeat protein